MKREIVLSDTIKFKKILNEKCNANIINFDKIAHFGYHNDLNIIKQSLLEFFICLNANYIKTFTTAKHTSGFVRFPALLKNIKIKSHFYSNETKL